MINRARSTKLQQGKLIEIMEQNPDLATGAIPNPTSFWKKVALELNSMGPTVKDPAAWKRTWIEKKSGVKRRLIYNKKEMLKIGDRKRSLYKLSELEERIAVITNMQDIARKTPLIESICIGKGKSIEDKEDEIYQQGSSHHIETTEKLERLHQVEITEQPDSSHNSHTEMNQPEPYDQRKTISKTASNKLAEMVLKQNEETNKYLKEISTNIKLLTEGTLGIYKEMLKHMKNNC